MSEPRLLRDLRWLAAAVGAELEAESEREGTWKEPRREMKVLRGRLLLVMELVRLRGCMAMGGVQNEYVELGCLLFSNHFNFYTYIPGITHTCTCTWKQLLYVVAHQRRGRDSRAIADTALRQAGGRKAIRARIGGWRRRSKQKKIRQER